MNARADRWIQNESHSCQVSSLLNRLDKSERETRYKHGTGDLSFSLVNHHWWRLQDDDDEACPWTSSRFIHIVNGCEKHVCSISNDPNPFHLFLTYTHKERQINSENGSRKRRRKCYPNINRSLSLSLTKHGNENFDANGSGVAKNFASHRIHLEDIHTHTHAQTIGFVFSIPWCNPPHHHNLTVKVNEEWKFEWMNECVNMQSKSLSLCVCACGLNWWGCGLIQLITTCQRMRLQHADDVMMMII